MSEIPRPSRTLRVDLDERSYPIRLGAGTLAGAGAAIRRCAPANRAMVVTVPGVGRRYGPTLQRSLVAAGYRVRRVEVPDGDATKNPRQLQALWDAMLDFGADRSTPMIALGGGMVGDLTGFAAATFLRGVPFVQIPTTVLSMVDASIGGKVAVNLPQGKNLVGAFYQPRLVWIDVAALQSLPRRERAAGFAEVVKAAAIWDRSFFATLEGQVDGLLALEPRVLIATLHRACAIKAEVVSRDEREQGVRRLLNFGHTVGHAIEKLGRYRGRLHGEAVAIGMDFAARRSEQLGFAPSGTADRLGALLQHFGLETKVPQHPRRAYLDALRVDKKMADSKIHFVILRGIGRADTVRLEPREVMPAARKQRATGGQGARRRTRRGGGKSGRG